MSSPAPSLLSGEEIKNEKLIVHDDDSRYRASTYDLSVGDIIPADGDAASEFRLAPGGMVRVVSRETLCLPRNITGHGLPRNTLCTRGVLAINIGIVDPGYIGPISSTLINFGRTHFVVRTGEPFLRISFHRCPESAKTVRTWERPDYLDQARQEVSAYSGPTFLSLEHTTHQAAERAFGKFKQSLVLWATLAAVALAVITIFVPLGASWVDRHLTDRDRLENEGQSIEERLDEKYAARLQALTDEIEDLRKRSTAVRARSGRQ